MKKNGHGRLATGVLLLDLGLYVGTEGLPTWAAAASTFPSHNVVTKGTGPWAAGGALEVHRQVRQRTVKSMYIQEGNGGLRVTTMDDAGQTEQWSYRGGFLVFWAADEASRIAR